LLARLRLGKSQRKWNDETAAFGIESRGSFDTGGRFQRITPDTPEPSPCIIRQEIIGALANGII